MDNQINLEIQRAKQLNDLLNQKPRQQDFTTWEEFYKAHKEWFSKFEKRNKHTK